MDMDPMSEKPLLPQFIDHLLRRFDFPLQPLRPSVLVKNRKYVVLSATLIFILLCHSLIFGPLIYGSEVLKSSDLTDLSPVFNDTLGFQHIYALILPERDDRKKPLLAGAGATNITLTVLDAVRDEEIPSKDMPAEWSPYGKEGGVLGCLVSHVLTWRLIIEENISTALIIESDVDWDMRIKRSMFGLSEGSNALLDELFGNQIHEIGEMKKRATEKEINNSRSSDLISSINSPYGDNWDIIWIGHCGSNGGGNSRYYAYNDPAAVPSEHEWVFGPGPESYPPRPNHTRLVFQAVNTVCTGAYAISNRGARKMEARFRTVNEPIDMHMWNLCQHDPELVCLSTFPQIFTPVESRSNINRGGNYAFGKPITEEVMKAGAGIQVSARMNAHLGLAGKGEEEWRWEWSENESTEAAEEERHRLKENEKEGNEDGKDEARRRSRDGG